MSDEFVTKRSWVGKFRDAFRGIYVGVWGESSFVVHGICAVAVVAIATWLQVTLLEWCLLVLCITGVLVAEFFNSALERLAKAVDSKPNPLVGAALDIASGAVLLAALGASMVGLVIFLPRMI